MKMQIIAVCVTVVNLVIMTLLLTQLHPAHANQFQNITPMLRARGLEIIDSMGKVRASITIQPASEVDGKKYSQNVILRLINTKGKPMVKIGADESGSGLTVINEYDEGIIINGRNDSSFIKITHKGTTRVFKP